MPIPTFIRDLRTHIGHSPLWLSGVSAVILDHDDRVLLTHRADTHEWAVVSGVLEPGEEPARAIIREIAEETGTQAEIIRLTSVDVTPMVTYPNGDQTQYLDLCFLARHISGQPHPADDENLAVEWFETTALPADLSQTSQLRITHALSGNAETWFRT